MIYLTLIVITLILQIIGLRVKEPEASKNLFISIIFLSIATFISGLIAGKTFAFLWIIIGILYMFNYIQLNKK